MEKLVSADSGDVNVRLAVAIVICNRNPHAEHWNVQAGVFCYVREGAVPVIVIKLTRPALWRGLRRNSRSKVLSCARFVSDYLRLRPIPAVDKNNVRIPI